MTLIFNIARVSAELLVTHGELLPSHLHGWQQGNVWVLLVVGEVKLEGKNAFQ